MRKILMITGLVIVIGVSYFVGTMKCMTSKSKECIGINNITTNKMKKIAPNMMVKDVDASVTYYKDKLGFESVMVVDEEEGDGTSGSPLVWAMLKNGDVEVMFQRADGFVAELPEMSGREVGGTFALYISMKDVGKFYDKIKNEVETVKELHKAWYGADEFVVKDLNGYILYFAEDSSE